MILEANVDVIDIDDEAKYNNGDDDIVEWDDTDDENIFSIDNEYSSVSENILGSEENDRTQSA